MRIIEVLSPVLGARCLVVVADDGAAVVVDPGVGVADRVLGSVRDEGLTVRAVLLTHGHVDHVWDAGPVSTALGVPVLVHRDDRYRLADPWGTLGPLGAGVAGRDGPLAALVRASSLDPGAYDEPADVRTFGTDPGGEGVRAPEEDLGVALGLPAGLLVALHAPGHTEGSTMYLLEGAGPHPVVAAGDVLFAGSIGRTDLPGGDPAAMARTLRDVVATLPPATVLPGHGPCTTMAAELAANPYLVRLAPPRPSAGPGGHGH